MTAPRSIRTRLLVGTGVGVALAFAIAGVLVHVLTRSSLRAQLDAGLAQEAHALSVLVEQERDEVDTDLTPDTLAGSRGRYFELIAEDGQVMMRSASLGTHELVPAALDAPATRAGDAALPDGTTGRQVTLAFFPRREDDDGTEPPTLTVLVVARTTDEVDDTMGRLDTVLGLSGVIAVALCLAFLVWATRYGLRPVREIAGRIAAIDPADPSARLDARGVAPELAPITDRVDELLARLTAVVARERELTAEVAHELRTPLAGLRSTLELALARDREPERYRSAMRDCLVIIDQTHRMIEALLALARLDAGSVTATRTPVAIGAIVDEVVALVAGRAEARAIAIVRTPGDATAQTDPDRLRVVIQNLIDNAVSHVDDGGTIEIALDNAPDRAVLRVANTGSRVGADAAAQVFDRFWRGDAARTAGEHAGLGLALCKKLVDLVGGTIAVDAEAGGTFAVTVTLPG